MGCPVCRKLDARTGVSAGREIRRSARGLGSIATPQGSPPGSARTGEGLDPAGPDVPLAGSAAFRNNRFRWHRGHRHAQQYYPADAFHDPAGKAVLHDHRPRRPRTEFFRAHAPGRLRGLADQPPHLDPARPDRGAAGRAERAHRKSHPDVSAQRIRDDHRIQRAGRQRGRKIPLPRRRGLSGELQRDRREAPAEHRHERRALRGLYADPPGPPPAAARRLRARRTAKKQRVPPGNP